MVSVWKNFHILLVFTEGQNLLTTCDTPLLQTALANEAMDQRKSWITSASNVLGDDDDKKLKGIKNSSPALSKQDVIDVDDSDEYSDHSC
jgi:hypothetical protein